MTTMNNETYTYLGGSDPERVESFGMFSAAGTDAVADILENAMDGASVDDIKRMIAAAHKRHPEIHDTAVRESMIGTLVAGSLAQHVLCDALGVEFVVDGFGAKDESTAFMWISRSRVERPERA